MTELNASDVVSSETPGEKSIINILKRDVTVVLSKSAYILSVSAYAEKLSRFKTWDFWGPLLFSLLVSLSFFLGSYTTDEKAAFSVYFFGYWTGAILIALTASLLGSTEGMMAMTSAILYSTIPTSIATILCSLSPRMGPAFIIFKTVLVVPTCLWGALISSRFLENAAPSESRILIRLPIALYHFTLGSMVLIA